MVEEIGAKNRGNGANELTDLQAAPRVIVPNRPCVGAGCRRSMRAIECDRLFHPDEADILTVPIRVGCGSTGIGGLLPP